MKIALMGYARAGKDTIASIMIEKLAGQTTRLAFGDQLKNLFHDIFDIPANPKPREGYEKFGQTLREIDQMVWIKQLEKDMKYHQSMGVQNFIITDVRQPNEAMWCKDNGFIVIFVSSKESFRKERSVNDSVFIPVNESEKLIFSIDRDYSIDNNYSLEVLKTHIDKLLERMENDAKR